MSVTSRSVTLPRLVEVLLRRILALWVDATVRPEDAPQGLAQATHPVCYVLAQRSLADLAVLHNACVRHGLPLPGRRLLPQLPRDSQAHLALTRIRGFRNLRLDRRPPPLLAQLVEAARADPAVEVLLVPVEVYWGRAPQKEASWFRLLFAEDWAIASRARRFATVLFNSRAVMVEFGEPVALRGILAEPSDNQALQRRVARLLRAQIRRQRSARIGPDLSHRRIIVTRVLRTRAVRAAVAQEVRDRKVIRRQVLEQARVYAEEIAANYSHAFVRFMETLLGRVWNRLYDGVSFEHVETLAQVAEGNEIVYVPCHRSHMDYLLLSYVIYRQGYAIPHIAAGVNLNLPIVGRFLRKGGAFFLRRSFRGNTLYTVVFMKYLAAIMARGHSIEYFIEGGRSRTGRLLQPRTGMLSMTVRSYLRDPVRPVVFLPVYFGYERVVEASTYMSELSGRPKEKETVLGLLRSIRVLRERFGTVHVNLGEPIALEGVLARHAPDWRDCGFDDDTRAPWVSAVVDDLALHIMRNINAAAAVTPVNLLAVILLATPRQALLECDLLRQLEFYRALMLGLPYHARVTVTAMPAAEMVAYGESLKVLIRQSHRLGDLLRMPDEAAILMTWYRNNVLHVFAMPSLVACAFISNAVMRTEDIQRLAWRIYPYVAAELFMRWSEEELPEVVDRTLQALARARIIEGDATGTTWRRPPPASVQAMQLSLLAQATIQIIERYYLAIALLLQAGSGQITQKALEERCQLMAQRMTMLYGFNSPEFFDRALFENFIDLLRARGVIRSGEGGRLEFDEVLVRVATDAQVVLSEQIRHSILQVTHN